MRRVDLDAANEAGEALRRAGDPLKHLCALMLRLSYRDMQRLGGTLFEKVPENYADLTPARTTDALLRAAEEIME